MNSLVNRNIAINMGASKIIDYSEAEVQIAKFAKELNVQDRTLTNKLSKFIKEEKLTQPLHGTYSIV